MVTEAGLNQWSPQFVFQVLLTEPIALAGRVPSLPLPKNFNNPPQCTACFRTRSYDVMSTPINPKPQARKPPGRLLESRKKEIKTTIYATCVTGLMVQTLKMSVTKLHCFFSRIVYFRTISLEMCMSWELAVGGEEALLCNFLLSKRPIYTPTLSHTKSKNSEILMLCLI